MFLTCVCFLQSNRMDHILSLVFGCRMDQCVSDGDVNALLLLWMLVFPYLCGFCWIISVGPWMLDCIRWLYGAGCRDVDVNALLLLWILGVPYLCWFCWIESVQPFMLDCSWLLYGSGCKLCWCECYIFVRNIGRSLLVCVLLNRIGPTMYVGLYLVVVWISL